MTSLIMSSTFYTPQVAFHPEGNFTISGKAMTTKACVLFKPILNWLEQYKKNPAQDTVLNLDFEILHVDCLVKLMDIFRLLESMIKKGHQVEVNWYYEKEDEDMKEIADMVSEILKALPVNKIMYEKDVA